MSTLSCRSVLVCVVGGSVLVGVSLGCLMLGKQWFDRDNGNRTALGVLALVISGVSMALGFVCCVVPWYALCLHIGEECCDVKENTTALSMGCGISTVTLPAPTSSPPSYTQQRIQIMVPIPREQKGTLPLAPHQPPDTTAVTPLALTPPTTPRVSRLPSPVSPRDLSEKEWLRKSTIRRAAGRFKFWKNVASQGYRRVNDGAHLMDLQCGDRFHIARGDTFVDTSVHEILTNGSPQHGNTIIPCSANCKYDIPV